MKVFDHKGVKVYACEPDGGGTPRETEMWAVEALMHEAFGDDAPALRHAPSGAPVMCGCDRSISISHCAGCVVLAVGDHGRRLGIDAESRGRERQLRRVVHKFLSPSQMEAWGDCDASLLRAWTIKEALYKAALTPGLPLCGIPLPDEPSKLESEAGCNAADVAVAGKCFNLMPLTLRWFDGVVTLAVENF